LFIPCKDRRNGQPYISSDVPSIYLDAIKLSGSQEEWKIMKTQLSRTFTFDAAHKLVDYEGICSRIHGHTYTLVITVEGEPDTSGMVMDFFDLKTLVNDSIIARLDHTYLNEFYTQPTIETVAADIFHTMQKTLKETHPSVRLYSVQLWEGKKSCVEVFP